MSLILQMLCTWLHIVLHASPLAPVCLEIKRLEVLEHLGLLFMVIGGAGAGIPVRLLRHLVPRLINEPYEVVVLGSRRGSVWRRPAHVRRPPVAAVHRRHVHSRTTVATRGGERRRYIECAR